MNDAQGCLQGRGTVSVGEGEKKASGGCFEGTAKLLPLQMQQGVSGKTAVPRFDAKEEFPL